MILGKKYYWLFQILGWGGFFLWHIFAAWSFEKMNTEADQLLVLKRAAGFSFIGLLMTHCLRLSVLKNKVLTQPVKQQVWSFLAFTLIASAVAGIAEMLLYKQLGIVTKSEKLLLDKSISLTVLNNFLGWFTYFVIWSAIYFIYHYITAAQKEQINTLTLKSHIKELQLKTIKTHINPHFIFNSLNGIRAMVDENPARARTAITELSNILRSSIRIEKTETVPLMDELAIVKDFLALEQMRFEDRLRVKYNIDDATLHRQVPPMMLQMLIENGIKHGISHEVNGGEINVTAQLTNNYLELVVDNTGTLKDQQNDEGFGIKSILERLSLLYGDNAHFSIRQLTPQTVQARLSLPNSL